MSKNYLFAQQNTEGGWAYSIEAASDTNMTAAGILALLSAGVSPNDSHIDNAVKYLQASQNNDGGFPYDPKAQDISSDAASTAWVLWALNALNIAPNTWDKSEHNPKEFLESLETSSGYFEFQKNMGEDSFAPITTSYAVIALLGKKLPLKIINPNQEKKYEFRIEGSGEQICAGKTFGPSALDIVKNASSLCGFTYHITETSFGPYLDQINSDTAQGLTGWLYLVNNTTATVGAADYVLQENDTVLWYYGNFEWLPLRITLSASEIANGSQATAKVEMYQNNSWQAVPDATIRYGANTATTNSSGESTFLPPEGYYKVSATKEGYIRSAPAALKVGEPKSASVALGVTIEQGSVLGGGTSNQGSDTIAFTVEPDAVDFGVLKRGASSQKNIKITNTGSSPIHVESVVLGDDVFRENLKIQNMPWQNFTSDIEQNAFREHPLLLNIPDNYTGTGAKSGEITFWAIAP